MSGHAFQTEDQFGDPLPQDQLGARPEQPVTSESEAPRLAEEQAAKDFNRIKMGGFLMELGLNILASNRDDAGEAVGQAFQQTRSDRTERRRVSAAEELAKQDRERKIRREDESDTLKQEKADREVAAAKRAESAADRDKLIKLDLEDGSVGYYKKQEGIIYDSEDPLTRKPVKTSKANQDRLTRNNKETSRRAVRGAIADKLKEITAAGSGRSDPEVKAIGGKSASYDDRLALARQRVEKDVEASKGILDYDARDVREVDMPEEEVTNYLDWNK